MSYLGWSAVSDPTDADSEVDYQQQGILSQPAAAIDSWRYFLLKRGIDVGISLLLLMMFALPGCVIAALIASTSRGSVFYREKRIGQYGYFFRIWKFRSMHTDAEMRSRTSRVESAEAHMLWRMCKSDSDPRITRFGRVLRRWSLDEVPQLLNVIAGDMSLIGPRPIVEAETPLYGRQIEHYIQVRPGLSGLWQVSGRSNIGYEKRAELDMRYVKTWKLKEDFRILIFTIPAVLKRIGAK